MPLFSEAKFGWSFRDYSILAGQQYRRNHQTSWNFELLYDRIHKSCTRSCRYIGFGVIYNFTKDQSELGIKGAFNPTFFQLFINRNTRFYPYLFGQGNFLLTTQNGSAGEIQKPGAFGFRPGLGLIGNFLQGKMVNIRASMQLSYNISKNNSQLSKDQLIFEFKVGFGINLRKLHPIKSKKDNSKNPG